MHIWNRVVYSLFAMYYNLLVFNKFNLAYYYFTICFLFFQPWGGGFWKRLYCESLMLSVSVFSELKCDTNLIQERIIVTCWGNAEETRARLSFMVLTSPSSRRNSALVHQLKRIWRLHSYCTTASACPLRYTYEGMRFHRFSCFWQNFL